MDNGLIKTKGIIVKARLCVYGVNIDIYSIAGMRRCGMSYRIWLNWIVFVV